MMNNEKLDVATEDKVENKLISETKTEQVTVTKTAKDTVSKAETKAGINVEEKN